jgi:hypothetical protein
LFSGKITGKNSALLSTKFVIFWNFDIVVDHGHQKTLLLNHEELFKNTSITQYKRIKTPMSMIRIIDGLVYMLLGRRVLIESVLRGVLIPRPHWQRHAVIKDVSPYPIDVFTF